MIMAYFVLFVMLNFVLQMYAFKTASNASSENQEESSFKTQITPLCNKAPAKLVVTGDIVKFSEFLFPDGTFGNRCGNSSNVAVVYIFALRKIVVDQSLNAPGFDLLILSPTWQVVGVSVINLNGLDGEFMPMPEPSEMGADGKDGRPGNPGKHGGNFFGMGEIFIDGKYLTINVSGGDGGPGQDGGVGGIGKDGRHALKANLSLMCSHSACDESGNMKITALDSLGEYSEFKCKEVYNYIIYDVFFLPPVTGNVRECSYYIYGGQGLIAGAGGDGGVGGEGGYPGDIFLVELFENSEISKVNNTGNSGMKGRGSQGGAWSHRGWDVSFKKTETYSNKPPHVSGITSMRYVDSKEYTKLDVTLGKDGVNARSLIDPVHGEKLNFAKIFDLMKEYTNFINSTHP